MKFLVPLLFVLAMVPAYAATDEVKAATVAYVDHEVDLLWDAVDGVADTYATKQDVADAVDNIDTSEFITTDGGTITGVLEVPTPTLPSAVN